MMRDKQRMERDCVLIRYQFWNSLTELGLNAPNCSVRSECLNAPTHQLFVNCQSFVNHHHRVWAFWLTRLFWVCFLCDCDVWVSTLFMRSAFIYLGWFLHDECIVIRAPLVMLFFLLLHRKRITISYFWTKICWRC